MRAAALGLYLHGAAYSAAAALAVVMPATCFTIFFSQMVAKTLHHMGQTGEDLKQTLTPLEFARCVYGFFVLNGLREMFYQTYARALDGARRTKQVTSGALGRRDEHRRRLCRIGAESLHSKTTGARSEAGAPVRHTAGGRAAASAAMACASAASPAGPRRGRAPAQAAAPSEASG